MKNIFKQMLLLAASLFISSSCVNSINDEPEDLGEKKLIFKTSTYKQTPMARAETTLADAFTKLDLAIYTIGEDKKYTLYKEVTQESGAEDFGTLTVEKVKYGTYALVIVGHKSTSHAILTDPTSIKFGTNNSVTDTFYYSEEFQVDKNSEQSIEVILKRAVAQFKMIMTNEVPEEVATISLNIQGTATAFNAISGVGSETTERSATITINDDLKGQTNKSISAFIFPLAQSVTKEDSEVTITVKALDSGKAVLAEVTHEHIPLTIGYITEYTGPFFDWDTYSFTITATTDWEDTIQEEY